jgi:general stress protein YciG
MSDKGISKSSRGFASMDQLKQRAIASKGGRNVPAAKRSFSRNRVLAAAAGRKGGESLPAKGRSFSLNRELAAEAGRRGGRSRSVGFAAVPNPDRDSEGEGAGEKVTTQNTRRRPKNPSAEP